MKEAVVDNAIKTVEKAVEIAGGRSYFRKSPLERLARDVRAARFHPPSAPISYQMAGERIREARAVVPVARVAITKRGGTIAPAAPDLPRPFPFEIAALMPVRYDPASHTATLRRHV